MTLTNVTLADNSAYSYGGGIDFDSGTVTVSNSTLTANSAQNGGGIAVFSGTLTLINSTIADNSATKGGGAIKASLSQGILRTVTVTNSTISGNSAQDGGGIYSGTDSFSGLVKHSLTLTNSTLADNSARNNGGGIYNDDNTVTLTNSTLAGNSAQYNGGGIYSNVYSNYTMTLANSTLAGNSAQYNGGGIDIVNGPVTLTNSTIVANRADSDGNASGAGGGVHNAATATLFNMIVAGNVKGTGAGAPNDLGGANLLAGSAFNLIGDPSSSGGLTNGTSGNIVGKNNGALLLPLAEILDPTLRNNGGPTLTHTLIASSPAINAGDNSQVATIPFDQRGSGFNRIVAGQVDIGAFEMPRPIFTDSFERAASPSLGPMWVNQAGALGIVVGLAQGTGASTVHIATLAGASATDLDLYATVHLAVNQNAGLVARYSGTGDQNYYLASLSRDADGNVGARLVRNVNGVVTELDHFANVVPNVGSSITGALRLRAIGPTLQLFLNGTLLATTRDTTFKSGFFGMRSTGTASLDDFQAYPVTTGVDYFDAFTQADDTTQSGAWTHPVGNFHIQGNKVHGTQALNLAVLRGVNHADVDVQASVDIPGANHSAGLLAHYQGDGDSNYYLANLARTNTGFTASLMENIAGVLNPLATTAITSANSAANLRLLITGSNLRFFVNNTLVANVFDTSFSTGSVGIRADQYSFLDDFHATAVTTALPFADNFNQLNGTGLGVNWTRRTGNFQVLGNAATGVYPAPQVNLATLVGVQPANVEVQANVTLVTTEHEIGLLAGYRGPSDANYYIARVLKTARGYSLSIVKNIRGTETLLTLINTATLTGPIKFRVEGASLKLFMNDVLMVSTSDSSFTAGHVGIRSIGTGTIDNFSATALNFLPAADNFDADTLNVNWSMHTGGYTMTAVADKAKGTATQNLMTLRRFDTADVDVQADINVPAIAGQVASLFARYSGPADNSMYLANVSYTGTQYVASIQKKVGGVTTTLTSVNVGTGAGTLRFTAIGGQLQLYWNGTALLTAFDFTLKSGSVGIRSSLDPTFDNFSAKQAS